MADIVMMKYLVLIVSSIALVFIVGAHGETITSGKECALYRTVVAVGDASHVEYVEVDRCMGYTIGHAQNERCVGEGEEVKVSIPNLTDTTVVNHTSCAMKCACESNGGKCPGGVHPVLCPTGMKWDVDLCMCVSKDTKKCEETGQSKKHRKEEGPKVTLAVLVGCLMGEFFLVVLVAFCCCRCLKSRASKMEDDDSSSVFNGRQQFTNLRRQLSSITGNNNKCQTEGSVSLLQDVKENGYDDSDETHMEMPP